MPWPGAPLLPLDRLADQATALELRAQDQMITRSPFCTQPSSGAVESTQPPHSTRSAPRTRRCPGEGGRPDGSATGRPGRPRCFSAGKRKGSVGEAGMQRRSVAATVHGYTSALPDRRSERVRDDPLGSRVCPSSRTRMSSLGLSSVCSGRFGSGTTPDIE